MCAQCQYSVGRRERDSPLKTQRTNGPSVSRYNVTRLGLFSTFSSPCYGVIRQTLFLTVEIKNRKTSKKRLRQAANPRSPSFFPSFISLPSELSACELSPVSPLNEKKGKKGKKGQKEKTVYNLKPVIWRSLGSEKGASG